MTNLLIIENLFSNIKNIINCLSNSMQDVKVYKISTSVTESLKILENESENIDIIILNYGLYGNKFFKYIDDHDFSKFEKSIIIISNNKLIEKNHNKYIYRAISKNNITNISDIIYKIINNKDINCNIKNRIIKELNKLHYNQSHIGTKYLLETIYEIYSKKYINFNLKGCIFPKLSKKYNIPVNTIKGDITQATKSMLKKSYKKVIKKYFKYFDYCKPTVKQVIETVLEYL